MYAEFYNLVEEPFPVTPDPKYLFLSDSHKEALAAIVYGIENRRGFVAIVGEVGTGKTTILRAYLDAIEQTKFTIIYVFNPDVTFDELVILIARELGISPGDNSPSVLISDIHHALIREYENNRTVILIIDEAQNTPVRTLESLRMLSNIETNTVKLLQIVLAGQPELEQLLGRHELRQLNQRIAVKATITPLSDEESRQYVKERIEAVSLDKRIIFDDAALTRIIKFAGGIPRSINIACDTALINGYGHGARLITDKIVRDAMSSLATPAKIRWSDWKIRAVAAGLLIALIAWMAMFRGGPTTGAGDQPSIASVGTTTVGVPGPVNVGPTSGDAEEAESAPEIELAGPAAVSSGSADSHVDTTSDLLKQDGDSVAAPEAAFVASRTVPEVVAGMTDNVAGAGVSSKTGVSDKVSEPLSLYEQFMRVQWDPARLSNQGFPVVHTIEVGDAISYLCIDIYGFIDPKLYELLQANNPRLVDINDVEVAADIYFPPLTDELQTMRSAEIKRRLRKRTRSNSAARPLGVLE